MNKPPRFVFEAFWTLLLLALWAPPLRPAIAQTVPPQTIDKDSVWSGIVEIRNEVCIRDAKVQVEPGSTIRFMGTGGSRGASIRLGGSLDRERMSGRSRLVLAGTSDRPITVETPDGNPPGFITGDLQSGCSLVARHVVFRRVGSVVAGKSVSPAVFLILGSQDGDLWLTHCRFSECARVLVQFIVSGTTAEISGCTFARTADDTAIELLGTGQGPRVISDNVSDAAFRVECPQTALRDNVLVGQWAAINVSSANTHGVSITDNYVHCTTDRDEGRYALRCASAEALVTNNVLLGGTYVIEQAPRTVTGNVLVGTATLRSNPAVSSGVVSGPAATTTHYLLSKPAPLSRVTDNLFLGPGYSAISAGRESPQLHIEHNLFDGWGVARRAVHFNALLAAPRDKPLAATMTGNVFTRYGSVPIVDAARQIGTVAHAGLNVFAEVGEPLYQTSDVQKVAPGDRVLRTFAELRLQAPVATRSALSAEEQLLQRQLSVAKVRAMWFDAYRPLQSSPLTGSQPAGPRPASSPG